MGETFDLLMEGLDEMKEHLEGGHSEVIVHVPEIDAAEVRKRTGLSQSKFSAVIGVSTATLKGWEQKRRKPRGPAAVLLALLDRDPLIVHKHLGEAS